MRLTPTAGIREATARAVTLHDLEFGATPPRPAPTGGQEKSLRS